MEWAVLNQWPIDSIEAPLSSRGILVRTEKQWMAAPSEGQYLDITSQDSTSNFALLQLSESELENDSTWSFLLRFVEWNIPALARFTEDLDIAPDGLIRALGWKAHYRSREEWKEWAALDALSEELFLLYDLPLNILRLWERMKDSRKPWIQLWQERNFRKNIIKEIIQYYHDLSPELQEHGLKQALEFSANWKARSGNFPAEQIRDQIYQMRYPEISGMQDRVFKLQKKLPSHKNLSFIIPDHLEAGYLDVRLRIESDADVSELIGLLMDAVEDGQVTRILELIQ